MKFMFATLLTFFALFTKANSLHDLEIQNIKVFNTEITFTKRNPEKLDHYQAHSARIESFFTHFLSNTLPEKLRSKAESTKVKFVFSQSLKLREVERTFRSQKYCEVKLSEELLFSKTHLDSMLVEEWTRCYLTLHANQEHLYLRPIVPILVNFIATRSLPTDEILSALDGGSKTGLFQGDLEKDNESRGHALMFLYSQYLNCGQDQYLYHLLTQFDPFLDTQKKSVTRNTHASCGSKTESIIRAERERFSGKLFPTLHKKIQIFEESSLSSEELQRLPLFQPLLFQNTEQNRKVFEKISNFHQEVITRTEEPLEILMVIKVKDRG